MLQKQALNINFSQGLDTKTDPWQVPMGKFLSLQNSVFTKAGLLQKRNGYTQLTNVAGMQDLTTLKGNLTALGSSVEAYDSINNLWINKGALTPMSLSTLPIARSAYSQTNASAAVADNGLMCVVYLENSVFYYRILDSVTGQAIVPATAITGATVTARTYFLAGYFIILFNEVISSIPNLEYIAIPINNPTMPKTAISLSSSYTPGSTGNFDATPFDQTLYVVFPDGSGVPTVTTLNSSLVQGALISGSGQGSLFSISANTYNFAVNYFSSGVVYTWWLRPNLAPARTDSFSASVVIDGNSYSTPVNITSTMDDLIYGQVNVFLEYAATAANCVFKTYIVNYGASALVRLALGVGLASKAFTYSHIPYVLLAYQSPNQSTYFLSSDTNIVSKIAYSNGGGYVTSGLGYVSLNDNTAQIAYLFKDLLTTTTATNTTSSNSLYFNTGVNLATFTFGSSLATSEIASTLFISGAQLMAYDGVNLTEQGFYLYPEQPTTTVVGTGTIEAGTYYYQTVYSWTDAAGNVQYSAPSLPSAPITIAGSHNIAVTIPTLRLTCKTNVMILVYRYSVANPEYHQVTSVSAPTPNDPTVNHIQFVDGTTETNVVKGSLIYTTGGVIEDIQAPATNLMTLFDNRLWLVDAEDPNLLWYSKQVIEGVPVEMSDLLTFYVAPTTGAQGSTGLITALFVMDDKLLIFKKDAIYYVNGVGPDNTGANSQYSQPTFITAAVGCSNPNSLVFTPQGVLFQSDKGIWILGRDLSTQYIGAPVEAYNNYTVASAVCVPGTNQVRFTLDDAVTLMYDYFFGQWGTFSTYALSSCLFQGLHTFLDSSGRIFQESPGIYLDGQAPVTLSFTTNWINLAGIQGYERLYDFYLLAKYVSPHFLTIGVSYDYQQGPAQQTIIYPQNYTPAFGGDSIFGGTVPYGGPGTLEQWRIQTQRQLCESFQISVQEYCTSPGAGLTISGLTCRLGIKKGVHPIAATNSRG